ncbi:hypothetical protein B0H11DRAFT_1931107 [Mycena galericulata]|nr:hypothetical protein B0H11DRAFT_1931107 [Mycena galericulata]
MFKMKQMLLLLLTWLTWAGSGEKILRSRRVVGPTSALPSHQEEPQLMMKVMSRGRLGRNGLGEQMYMHPEIRKSLSTVFSPKKLVLGGKEHTVGDFTSLSRSLLESKRGSRRFSVFDGGGNGRRPGTGIRGATCLDTESLSAGTPYDRHFPVLSSSPRQQRTPTRSPMDGIEYDEEAGKVILSRDAFAGLLASSSARNMANLVSILHEAVPSQPDR